MRMHEDEVEVDETLIRRLLATQMPDLADRPLDVVEPWGTDNAHLAPGRRPRRSPAPHPWAKDRSSRRRVAAPPRPHLPVAVPEPVAVASPAHGYPYRWAVHRWIPGEGASLHRVDDPVTFALDLADAVRRLQPCPPTALRSPATGPGRCTTTTSRPGAPSRARAT